MELLQVLVLALLQGLTEFLPISSSAHLILVPVLTGWQDQGLAFDIAVHVGTLLAVIVYFRNDLLMMGRDWMRSLITRRQTVNSRLAWAVVIGTIPVGIAGLFGKPLIEAYLRSPLVIAATTVLFGLLLGFAYVRGKQIRDEHSLSWVDVFIIGVAQALALIPGTSRSGITMTAGLLRGLNGPASARFSFLLSVPVIALAGGLQAWDLLKTDVIVDWSALMVGVLMSALSAYLCIYYFLQWLTRIGMLPFVVYRLLLGLILFVLFI